MAARLEWGGWLGRGIQTSSPDCTWRLDGHSFNPPDLSWPTPCHVGIYGAQNVWDLTCYWVGHEAVLNLNCVMVACGCSYSGYLEMCWLRGAAWYFLYDYYINISSSYDSGTGAWTCEWMSTWSYSGIKPFCQAEICCNGTDYCVKTCLEAIGYCTHYFCTCCLQACRLCNYPQNAASSIWLCGTCLGYTPVGCSNWPSYPCTWRSVILHDGSTHGSAGVAKAGSFWVESGGGCRLYWVDCDGCIRRSKQGDSIGYRGYDGMPSNVGVPKAGYIWAQSAFQDDAIFFIDSTGQKIRIGPGDLYGDCY